MDNWLATASRLIDQDQAGVLVTVLATRGSAPRDAGTRMIVCADHCHGTIGGGHLEYKAIAMAREKLAREHQAHERLTDEHAAGDPLAAIEQAPSRADESTRLPTSIMTACDPRNVQHGASLHRFPLGASLGQCCGGLVLLLFEPLLGATTQWLQYLQTHHTAGRPVVMVTQAITDAGDSDKIVAIHKLLLSDRDRHGSLFGAQKQTLQYAQHLLTDTSEQHQPADTSLWFERLRPNDFRVYVFGAGHVGKAVVNVLATLPCAITWIDSRAEEFPISLPDNVTACINDEPESELESIPVGSYILIMTHNHAVDEPICAAALQSDSVAWCGLIGSVSKRRKFLQRFRARGMSDAVIAGLSCPIGLPELSGKHPGEIAVSVVAQILRHRQQALELQAITAHQFQQFT